MTEIALVNGIHEIDPVRDVLHREIKFLGVDVENVLTDYGNPEVFPGIANKFDELLTAVNGLGITLLTNKDDPEFLDEVVSQLPGDINYVGPAVGMKRKPHPEMFQMAIHDGAICYEGYQAAMIDDQFKAYRGASKAGYATFFWAKPKGEHQHLGVRLTRPYYTGLVRPAIGARQATARTLEHLGTLFDEAIRRE